jgi:hypothetical protein
MRPTIRAERHRGPIGAACLLFILASAGPALAEAIQATEEIPEDELLDVAIEVFDPGVPDPATTPPRKMEGIFPDLRRSEARYVPMKLKETLESTGQWGAVRVVPSGTASVDVRIRGEIRESNGFELLLRLEVIDASGRRWLDEKYKGDADFLAYSAEELTEQDPYQALYDRIANDLLAARQNLVRDDILELRRIAELRFAAALAPDVFGDYLDIKGQQSRYEIKRLPSEDDPMMARVASIRERDYMLVDALNEHYGTFALSMEAPYDDWRAFTYEEQSALAELRRQARTRKILGALAILGAFVSDGNSTAERVARDAALIGGMAAIQSGIAKGQEAKIHREALEELSASFESEVAPLVVEVEGETVRLTGSREEQYATWRQLLRRIYAAETGLPVDPNSGDPDTTADLRVGSPVDQ